ncbi:MAG: isoprenylcysteine carboxylmethyltransferase family protein [Candidatus Manganitrophaceae bacterium]|nr:MAG: isoprenylcysteine carboxylmethyltransferase family protein [Candidatus Manganitrophaceae bacterium]
MIDLSKLVGKNRIVTSLLLGMAFWFFARPSFVSIAAGAPFVLLGEAIRTWSSGYIRKNQELATTGPYAFTRNPLYLGNGVMGFGFVVMGRSGVLLGLFLFAFAFIYRSTIRQEEERLLEKFGERFSEYVRTVPRFFPHWPGWPSAEGRFDWGLVMKHREHRTWLGILVVLALMMIKVS